MSVDKYMTTTAVFDNFGPYEKLIGCVEVKENEFEDTSTE